MFIIVVGHKIVKRLAISVIAIRKEFMWVVSANAIQAGMMMVLMNNAFNVTLLGIYLLLLLKFINSST